MMIKRLNQTLVQPKIPKLPIPPLSNLKTKYLASLLPLYEETVYKQKKDTIELFIDGFGKELQSRLEAYGKDRDNWIKEIWLKKSLLRMEGTQLNQRKLLVRVCGFQRTKERFDVEAAAKRNLDNLANQKSCRFDFKFIECE